MLDIYTIILVYDMVAMRPFMKRTITSRTPDKLTRYDLSYTIGILGYMSKCTTFSTLTNKITNKNSPIIIQMI